MAQAEKPPATFINRDQPEKPSRQPPRWRFYTPGSTLFNAIRRDVSSFRSCSMPTHLVVVQARSAFTGPTCCAGRRLPRCIRARCWRFIFPPPPSGISIWRGRRTFINAQLNALQTAAAEKGIPLLFHEVADFNASIETVKNVTDNMTSTICL